MAKKRKKAGAGAKAAAKKARPALKKSLQPAKKPVSRHARKSFFKNIEARPASQRVIVITGATGRIGRAIISRFSREPGISMRLIGRRMPHGFALPSNAKFFKADISRPKDYMRALRGSSAVIHLAGLVSFSAPLGELMEQNAANSGILASACVEAGVPKLVLASSIAVYGKDIAGKEIDERFPANPTTDYGKSKLEGENEALKSRGKLKIAILRLGLVYGAGIDFGYYKMLDYITRGKMRIIGSGQNMLPFVHSSDVASAFFLACVHDNYRSGSIFNIVGELKSQLECLGMASQFLGAPEVCARLDYGLASAYAASARILACKAGLGDCKKACESEEFISVMASDRRIVGRKAWEVLGFKARVPLASGIAEVARAYLKDREGTK
ncbi:MAG: NAD(P)-dependent oxidoreductase [Candidatus Micrarchaeia archaeon]